MPAQQKQVAREDWVCTSIWQSVLEWLLPHKCRLARSVLSTSASVAAGMLCFVTAPRSSF